MDEIKLTEKDLLQEGTQAADGLEATSASDAAQTGPAQDEPAPSLSTPVAPTAEERADAGITEPAGEPEGDPTDPLTPTQPTQPTHIEDHADANHVDPSQSETPTQLTDAQPAQERMFTQSQVNEMMGECRMSTRERTFRYIYDRYGVSGDKELDDLIGNAQRYDTLHEQYEADRKGWNDQSKARDAELAGLKEHIALMESGIDKSKYDDAKAILGYKGLEINADNIQAELTSHPEWRATQPAEAPNPNFMKKPDQPNPAQTAPTPTEPQSRLSVLGNEPKAGPSPEEEEEAMAWRYFK